MSSKKDAGAVKITALAMSLVLLTSCGGNGTHTASSSGIESAVGSPSPTTGQSLPLSDNRQEQQALYNFINTQLTGSYGVYTNALDTDESAEVATGHEVLSESASLMMIYAVLAGDKELFDRQWGLGQQTFDMEGGFSYRYSPKLDKKYPVNAAVDDLRLIGALYEAGEVFDDGAYTEEANKYSQRLYDHNVKDGYLFDLYDNKYKVTNESVTLCYIDLNVLRKLSISSEVRGVLLHNMNSILEDGYLSNAFPFYETRFDYKTGEYSSENINTVESLLSILHLAEVNQHKLESIRYLKEHVEAGTLYGQYTREGKPANDIRSTAIYALTAMIGAQTGDDSLYRTSIERMNEFRVADPGSPLYGGFGNTATGQAYSFDNLMALLAYSYSSQNRR